MSQTNTEQINLINKIIESYMINIPETNPYHERLLAAFSRVFDMIISASSDRANQIVSAITGFCVINGHRKK